MIDLRSASTILNEMTSVCLFERPSETQFAANTSIDDTRFFIVKSFNEDNVLNCIRDSTWNTQLHVGKHLSHAFQSSENVILVFSINRSKAFQGYVSNTSKPFFPIRAVIGSPRNLHLTKAPVQARMESLPGSVLTPNWQETINWELAGAFKIRWLAICSTRFQKIGHLRNSYNENLPVLIGKDGQEIESQCGWALLEFIDAEAEELLSAWNDVHHREEENSKR